jgi:hypothetical protein
MHVNPREVKGSSYSSSLEWHRACRKYCSALAFEHRDGRIDSWTPKAGQA